ncbi:uncharacterized protein PHACADRAFT_29823 [Phanerochaete carnosa HHB-10118-sp]|uniref:C2H2-type domain-containing protein n=1 Tax=Phanerochaete carnosa (strain HHB-10118-sp) TaxID=650164 RepID=K5W626_PHACS|nr:uncharacterized protein PHACADRAFT_29823 [Phanerochaete carnosa HHB-10118-sp]EKM54620.1 hypothetical protein PHACADRAFT_29823 [Phanerochaete carnosa HHB-10118-sp]
MSKRTMASGKIKSSHQPHVDPRTRGHHTSEMHSTALVWLDKVLQDLEERKRDTSRPTRITCGACGSSCANNKSSVIKHADTHRPFELREYVCPYCEYRFGQQSQLLCHLPACPERNSSHDVKDVELPTCGIILLTESQFTFACGYTNKHARSVTQHRQRSHGQSNLRERREGVRGLRPALTHRQRKSPNTIYVWMDRDCTEYSTAGVPQVHLTAVREALEKEVADARYWAKIATAKKKAAVTAKKKARQPKKRDATRRIAAALETPTTASSPISPLNSPGTTFEELSPVSTALTSPNLPPQDMPSCRDTPERPSSESYERTTALPGFHEAFGDVPSPHHDDRPHTPPSPSATFASISSRENDVIVPDEHRYYRVGRQDRAATPPRADFRQASRYRPYAVPGTHTRHDCGHAESLQGSSRDPYAMDCALHGHLSVVGCDVPVRSSATLELSSFCKPSVKNITSPRMSPHVRCESSIFRLRRAQW